MTAPPIKTKGAQIWVCDDCGRRFAWNDESYWFGSFKNVDDGDWSNVNVYCGCRPMLVEAVA